jgi:hypothetical protein
MHILCASEAFFARDQSFERGFVRVSENVARFSNKKVCRTVSSNLVVHEQHRGRYHGNVLALCIVRSIQTSIMPDPQLSVPFSL